MKPIQRIHHGIDGGIETECHCCCLQIVINSFRNTHAIDPSLLQLKRGGHRSITTDDDQCVDTRFLQNFTGFFDYFGGNDGTITRRHLGYKVTPIRGPDNRSAQGHDVFGAFAIEHGIIARRQ